ncbi:MAG: histidine phosphatase family protein [Clostridium sp.]|nr:histidine phosphatase family protein [Clostridium sp.]
MDKNIEVNLFVTRHGKTEFNNYNKVQGWSDSALTKEGIEVARYLGEGIKDIEFKKAYSSDFGRASDTLDIVLEKNINNNIEVERKENLREWNFGAFEMGPSEYMLETIGNELKIEKEEVFLYDLEKVSNTLANLDKNKESENWNQIEKRLKKAMDEIVEEMIGYGGGNALVVTHGLTIASLIKILDKDHILEKPLENASITHIKYKNGEYKIVHSNNLDYIEKGKLNSK